MDKATKAARIQTTLDELFPTTPIPLDHHDPYTLLVAVLLSAQATDVSVNKVTPALFALVPTPQALADSSPEAVGAIIQSIGLWRNKARNLVALGRILVEQHGGQVPADMEALERLPGVGHKTASVVMAQAFGQPAFPVDTHIHRLAARWGLSDGRSVERTEADLKALFPTEAWNRLHLQIIFFGRQFCPARRHDPASCPICSWASESPPTGDATPNTIAPRPE